MSHLPELRASLVDAARRQAEVPRSEHGAVDGAPAPSGPVTGARRRIPHLWRHIGTVASLAAMAAALVVGVIAIGGDHRRRPATSTPSGGTALVPVAQQALARKGAEQTLSAFRPPPGATHTDRDPSSPARLGTPADTIQLPHVVTVHGFWRAPGTVAAAARWIQAHPPDRATLDSSQESGSSSAAARRTGGRTHAVLEIWGGTFVLSAPLPALAEQQLVVEVAPAAGGGVAIRADGQAGWLPLRPAAQQVPTGADRVAVHFSVSGTQAGAGRSGAALPQMYMITDSRRIQRITALLNMMPRATRIRPGCGKEVGPGLNADLYAPGQAVPLATARLRMNCGTVSLTVPGRASQTLSLGPGGAMQPLVYAIAAPELLAGPARSGSRVPTTATATATVKSRR
jgi:hypothetical protein